MEDLVALVQHALDQDYSWKKPDHSSRVDETFETSHNGISLQVLSFSGGSYTIYLNSETFATVLRKSFSPGMKGYNEVRKLMSEIKKKVYPIDTHLQALCEAHGTCLPPGGSLWDALEVLIESGNVDWLGSEQTGSAYWFRCGVASGLNHRTTTLHLRDRGSSKRCISVSLEVHHMTVETLSLPLTDERSESLIRRVKEQWEDQVDNQIALFKTPFSDDAANEPEDVPEDVDVAEEEGKTRFWSRFSW